MGPVPANGIVSAETPALVNDNGTLRMVYTDTSRGPDERRLREAEFTTGEGGTGWSTGFSHGPWASPYSTLACPALAFFNNEVHRLCVPGDGKRLLHLVRDDSEGYWKRATAPDGTNVTPPDFDRAWMADTRHLGRSASLSLAVHDNKLHLANPLASPEHAVFDGTTWTLTSGLEGHHPRRGFALASFDGKLHAVYPPSTTTPCATPRGARTKAGPRARTFRGTTRTTLPPWWCSKTAQPARNAKRCSWSTAASTDGRRPSRPPQQMLPPARPPSTDR